MTSNISSNQTATESVVSSTSADTMLTLTGDVASGMGKAQDFLSLPGYVSQFKDRLAYEPYPGTLNVTLTGDIDSRIRLATFPSITIDSWELDGQTFGGAECYPCIIANSTDRYDEAHVLVPDRTDHDDDKLELIAPDRLRDAMSLTDGDELTVMLTKRS